MTAKEKAKELVEKFMLYSVQKTEISTEIMQYEFNYKIKRDLAIQCAIIAVDEIIKELTDLWKILDKQKVFGASNPTTIRIKYYESVKTELEKL